MKLLNTVTHMWYLKHGFHFQILKNILLFNSFKGTVQPKLSGVESGINLKGMDAQGKISRLLNAFQILESF